MLLVIENCMKSKHFRDTADAELYFFIQYTVLSCTAIFIELEVVFVDYVCSFSINLFGVCLVLLMRDISTLRYE